MDKREKMIRKATKEISLEALRERLASAEEWIRDNSDDGKPALMISVSLWKAYTEGAAIYRQLIKEHTECT